MELRKLFLLLGLVMAGCAFAQQPYQMAGPYAVIARDGEYRNTKAGSERDMKTALTMAREGRTEEAMRIIDAYADTLQRLDGHDAPLCAIQCYWLVRAMISVESGKLRAESSESVRLGRWQAMVRRALLPMIEQFDADSPYANGNWGAIINRLRMACAIFLGDDALYKQAIDYFLRAYDNGSLPHYISETGQCQESGRDQGHAQLGLGALSDICEMAWKQGDDLWGALDCRLMKGMEYSARYNLGYDVPFETWQDCTGLYCDWTEPGSMGRGLIRDIYQTAYNHYTGVKGLQMPYTRKLLALQAKAERRGDVSEGMEARSWRVPGVKEGSRLHQVFTYPAPEGAPLKNDYDVYVQPRGSKEWTHVDTYVARVNAPIGNNKHRVSEISYCCFDFTGDVFVRVVTKNRKFASARIRPDYRGTIANVQNDSTVQFLLFQPENLSVEFAGSITDNLLLFTSKPPVGRAEAQRQAKAANRQFRYYGPGIYRDDTIRIASNTTVYLEGGSYFTGTFAIEDVENVSILGRGIARPASGYEGCHVHRSRQVLVDGLTVCTCPIGGSNGVTLHDVRSISHPGWGDGLNVFASENVLFDRVFCRNSDDCTTAYATRKGFTGSTRNVRMRNSTLWADVAHPIFIGLHGNPEQPDSIVGLTYENIDILCQSEPQVDYQGCLAINCGDENAVKDVTFDNIRIEGLHQGSPFQVKISYNQKYCTAPGRSVEDILFRNIRYKTDSASASLSIINGYDENRKIRNIRFEGLKINGQTLYDDMPGKPRWYATADYVPMYVGNHVENVTFARRSEPVGVGKQIAYCSRQVDRALQALRPYDFKLMPRNIMPGESTWNLRPACAEEWCSGFWPGILWMAFQENKSEAVHKAATGYTQSIIPIVEGPVFDHDLGFITINSLLKGYEVSKDNHYKQLCLQAAEKLATLFNDRVGTMLSWPRHVSDYGGHNTIMDNMMNLELLFWAADNGGDSRLRDMAVRHAETTMKNHFRPDGSCYHVAVYDTLTGQFLRGVTHQGYSDGSMWSRGQAWAIYGYTMVYRYTHDQRFLDFAQKVADIYLKRLRATSDDLIPLWDMDDPRGTAAPKDASAACIVASALLELSQYAPARGYADTAQQMLCQLSTDRYQSRDRNTAFLLHSTGHHPAGSEIDASIIYADYYYLEALQRYKLLNE